MKPATNEGARRALARDVAGEVVAELRPLLGDHLARLEERLRAASPEPDSWLSAEQVGRLIGKSRRTVTRLVAQGILRPGRRVGGTPRWKREWVEEDLSKRRRGKPRIAVGAGSGSPS